MTDTPKKLFVDLEKGTSEYIDLTPAEIAEHDQLVSAGNEARALRESQEAEKEALKVSAKAKLVSGEPLTAEEAAVLVI